jgi:hypothetical protein
MGDVTDALVLQSARGQSGMEIRNDLQGSGRGLIKVLSLHLPVGSDVVKTTETLSSALARAGAIPNSLPAHTPHLAPAM